MLREFVTQTAAGSADLAIAVMLLAFGAFILALVWVYRRNGNDYYRAIERLPLDEGSDHE